MSSGLVLYETADRIATIALNRPEVLNAIVSPMWQEIDHALANANRGREENMGHRATQLVGSLLDGAMRNSPEAKAFVDKKIKEGVPAAVAERDGPFGDYSQRKKK